ncbi:peptide deformylase [Lacinutrix sp. 5H-3-7-4]|uniref:peptide deformylase n=1 Tax=Lacinutrix sp. (strain 5H-3-7-4) TaxID=983544 RepID=UPI00020A37CF|nr:peptide deformylase [Lacinutrix sp. 5H-3-7-4]AEH00379.1 Peptide deformylase [Lacinutrix sp. 5H-3-7-4]
MIFNKVTFYNWCLIILILGCSLACISSKTNKSTGFSKFQARKIMNAKSNMPMRVFKITNTADSLLLRSKSAYVKPDSTDVVLNTFIKRLYATVRDSISLGVGIAAPQVGVLKNVIWVQRFDKDEFPFEVYLNPKIISYSQEKQTRKEGCLSIPNRTDVLNNRSKIVKIEYDKINGEHIIETITDFTAIIFQHEIDHLNGILYLDHLEKEINDAKN